MFQSSSATKAAPDAGGRGNIGTSTRLFQSSSATKAAPDVTTGESDNKREVSILERDKSRARRRNSEAFA